ncbi:MAG TPA: N-acetyltransferase [Candidatus Thermoplasmatota archaeon]|nr:N-acetyltransferase [Candidatus Thermoplasmatota archaeon]
MALRVRPATLADLPTLLALERLAFQDYRRASSASLRRSILSPRQSVWVVDGPDGQLAGLLVLWHFPHRVRIYDIATHPDLRGQGIGKALLLHAEAQARAVGCSWMTLEAEEADPGLVGWYRHHGYAVVDRLPDFYHEGCHAVRMTKRL